VMMMRRAASAIEVMVLGRVHVAGEADAGAVAQEVE